MPKTILPENHKYAKGRICSRCKEFKSADNFYLVKNTRYSGGIAMDSRCKCCEKEGRRKDTIKYKYGITTSEYQVLLDLQNNRCAICDSVNSNNSRTNGLLFIDHCHTTGRVRGLLCSNCNSAIGYLKDDVKLLQNAILYLNKTYDIKDV